MILKQHIAYIKLIIYEKTIKKLSFPLERCPRLCLGPSKWVCMEVVNINNDRSVFSISWLKPWELKIPVSLLIH